MKTKLISFVSVLLLLVFSVYVNAAGVRLQWGMNCESNVVKYILYYTTNVLDTPETIIEEIEQGMTNQCGELRVGSTNIFYGFYTNMVEINGRTNTICEVTNLVADIKYYFTIVAVNDVGSESVRAKEISHVILSSTNDIPVPAPVKGLNVISFEE